MIETQNTKSAYVVTRNFLTLASGEVFARLISFATIIYVARSLGAEAYGIVGFAAAVLVYFAAIVDGGVEAVGPSEIAGERSRLATLVPSILLFRFLLAILLAILVAVFGNLLLPDPEAAVLTVYALTLFGTAASTRWVHLGLERTRFVSFVQTVAEAVKIFLILQFVRGPNDLIWIPLSQAIADGFAAVVLLIGVLGRGIALTFRFDFRLIARLYKRSWPLMATTLCGLIIYNSDVMFLRSFRSRDEVGYYLAAFSLIGFLGQFGMIVRLSLLPTLSRITQAEQRTELYHTAMARVFALGFPLAVGGFLVAPGLAALAFGKQYEPSEPLFRILICSIPLLLLRSVLQAMLISRSRENHVLQITGWTSVLNLLLNILIIPRYGATGAAFTTVLTEALRMALAQYFLNREGIPAVTLQRFWRPIVAGIFMGMILVWIWPPSLKLKLLTGVICYCVAMIVVGAIRLERRKIPVLDV